MEYENLNEVFRVNRTTNEPVIKEYDFSQFFKQNQENTNINEYVDNNSFGFFETPETTRHKELHQQNINEILHNRKLMTNQERYRDDKKVDFNVEIVTMDMFMKLTENRVRKIKEQILKS